MKKLSIKGKISVISVVSVIALSAIGATTAFFSTEDTARNVITTGNIKIDLFETALNNDGEHVPFEDRLDVMPGETVSKNAQVENIGGQEAYIRVKVTTLIELADGKQGDATLITLDFNTEDWTEKDGYWYYNYPLAPDETTSPLFTCAEFSGKMNNDYQESKAIIDVTAYGVQKAHNGDSALTALGWGKDPVPTATAIPTSITE